MRRLGAAGILDSFLIHSWRCRALRRFPIKCAGNSNESRRSSRISKTSIGTGRPPGRHAGIHQHREIGHAVQEHDLYCRHDGGRRFVGSSVRGNAGLGHDAAQHPHRPRPPQYGIVGAIPDRGQAVTLEATSDGLRRAESRGRSLVLISGGRK